MTMNAIGTLADGSGAGRVAAFWAAVGCGAEIVAAVWAEAGAVATARAEDGAKAQRWEDGEEKSEEPVGEADGMTAKKRRSVSKVTETEEPEGSVFGAANRPVAANDVRRQSIRVIAPPKLGHRGDRKRGRDLNRADDNFAEAA
jgi:hypothetical protein